jgi:hypothetical protein
VTEGKNALVDTLASYERVVVCYHGADIDGRLSAAIVAYWLEWWDYAGQVSWHPVNYGDAMPPRDELEGALVFVLDYSFAVQEMLGLDEIAAKLVWIDHHARAVLRGIEAGLEMPMLISCLDLKWTIPACLLTWRWLFPGKPVPLIRPRAGHLEAPMSPAHEVIRQRIAEIDRELAVMQRERERLLGLRRELAELEAALTVMERSAPEAGGEL